MSCEELNAELDRILGFGPRFPDRLIVPQGPDQAFGDTSPDTGVFRDD